MSYNLLQDKAEQALQVLLVNAGIENLDTSKIFTSFVSGEQTVGTHTVSIVGEGGIEDGFNSGNYRVSVVVRVSSSLDVAEQDSEVDPVSNHRAIAGAVFDVLTDTDLATNLSAAISDFTVFNSVERRHGRQRVENRKAVSEMLLEFAAAPSTIPAS